MLRIVCTTGDADNPDIHPTETPVRHIATALEIFFEMRDWSGLAISSSTSIFDIAKQSDHHHVLVAQPIRAESQSPGVTTSRVPLHQQGYIVSPERGRAQYILIDNAIENSIHLSQASWYGRHSLAPWVGTRMQAESGRRMRPATYPDMCLLLNSVHRRRSFGAETKVTHLVNSVENAIGVPSRVSVRRRSRLEPSVTVAHQHRLILLPDYREAEIVMNIAVLSRMARTFNAVAGTTPPRVTNSHRPASPSNAACCRPCTPARPAAVRLRRRSCRWSSARLRTRPR